MRNPIVLAFIGNYLPGYKAGGILRTMVNTVEMFHDEIDFWIVTRDRDVGDTAPYDGVQTDDWQEMGNARVYYLSPDACTLKNLSRLISETRHDVIYLNSFFDPLTVLALLARRLGKVLARGIVVAPRGEFGWASLKQKYLKKWMYIKTARLFGLYRGVRWHVSSEYEAVELCQVMKVSREAIDIALDLPKVPPALTAERSVPDKRDRPGLRLVFVSRIAREKNLDYALRVLKRLSIVVDFDIYGPVADAAYWKECNGLINSMPGNVQVRYLGSHRQPVDILDQYDILLLPTGGENYGHVIAESLTVGTPVLVSDKTPWRHLEGDGLGWDIALEDMEQFVDAIERYANFTDEERLKRRRLIEVRSRGRLLDPAVVESNRRLFTRHVSLPVGVTESARTEVLSTRARNKQ